MRALTPARCATLALLMGGLACASNTARTDETTGAAPVDTTSTGYRGMERDTTGRDTATTPYGRPANASDSARTNQAESGVTNTETGQSTTGQGVTQTRPDQGQPVTSKGDTVGHVGAGGQAADTTGRANQNGQSNQQSGQYNQNGQNDQTTTGGYTGATGTDTSSYNNGQTNPTGNGAGATSDTSAYNRSSSSSSSSSDTSSWSGNQSTGAGTSSGMSDSANTQGWHDSTSAR